MAGRRRHAASPTGTSRATRRTSASRSPISPRAQPQVLLRLARRADRLPRSTQEALRLRRRTGGRRAAQLRRLSRRPGGRAVPFHRQGHRVLPHAVLAGDAAFRRTQDADQRLRPRLHHRVGREDVQVARDGHLPQRYIELGLDPEWLRYYIAAKLNAHVEDIDFGPDDFIARVNSDLIGKYVNIASRASGFVARSFDGALATPAESANDRANRLTLSQMDAEAARANYEAREFGKVLRDAMKIADRINEAFDAAQPWAACERPGVEGKTANRLLAGAAGLPATERDARAGAAAGRLARGA